MEKKRIKYSVKIPIYNIWTELYIGEVSVPSNMDIKKEGVKDGMRGMIDILCEKGCGSMFAVIDVVFGFFFCFEFLFCCKMFSYRNNELFLLVVCWSYYEYFFNFHYFPLLNNFTLVLSAVASPLVLFSIFWLLPLLFLLIVSMFVQLTPSHVRIADKTATIMFLINCFVLSLIVHFFDCL